MNCKYKVTIKRIQYNYKVQMSQLQGKYKFNIFCTGYNDSEIRQKIEDMYNAWPKVTGEGEEITLNDTVSATMPLGLKGNTYQEGTPTPDTPQEVHTVSGDNTIKVEGKNLFNDNAVINASTYATDTHILNGKRITTTLTGSGYYQCRYIVLDIKKYIGKTFRLKANYVASGNNVPAYTIGICDSEGNNRTSKGTATTSGTVLSYIATQDTITDTKHYLYVILYVNAGGNATNGEYADFTNITLTVDNEDMTYTPYNSQSYPVNLGAIELCKISTYEDRIFKNETTSPYYDNTLELNAWYLKKEINKIKLGDLTWTANGTGTDNYFYYASFSSYGNYATESSFCSHYSYVPIGSTNTNQGYMLLNNYYARIRYGAEQSTSDFQTWLTNNNVSLYYPLSTPTYTKIEGTLASQLEAVYRAKSKEGQTNISQVNNDAPFIITASTLKDLSSLGTSTVSTLNTASVNRLGTQVLNQSIDPVNLELNSEDLELNNEEETIEETPEER